MKKHVTEAFSAVYNQSDSMADCIKENEGHGRKEWRNNIQTQAKIPPNLKEKWLHIKSFIEVAS